MLLKQSAKAFPIFAFVILHSALKLSSCRKPTLKRPLVTKPLSRMLFRILCQQNTFFCNLAAMCFRIQRESTAAAAANVNLLTH